eukprot:CAMPEP_0173107358 /NCGR_PEP_ID=MMETSP1102-20130122/41749_1 /TAXON_ID=49646 /ORGANISM="Geminigera sp., Strain Caron Lab Isolate" /LENGTH=41 /DNA_ID= /DNA_START= /DNA_END= /DNA_ORIENTATION=
MTSCVSACAEPRAVVAAIAHLLARAARVNSFRLCRLGCEQP